MSKQLVEITGFKELHFQMRKLEDSVKRKELLKILGQVANPTLKAAKSLVPVSDKVHYRYVGVKKGKRRRRVTGSSKIAIPSGNLRDSVSKIVAKRSKVNARLDVGAKARKFIKKYPDGYYAHMLVPKGFKGTNRKSGNNDFFNKAFNQTKGGVTVDAEKRVARYIQKQINRLSNLSNA